MTPAERRSAGQRAGTRFQSKYTPGELVEAVRVVSAVACPEHPASCTQTQFDAARDPAGLPELPRARAIAARLHISWGYLLEVTHDPDRNAWKTITAQRGNQGRKGFTLDEIYAAMRHVAGYLGQPTITRADYERGRELIVAADRRAYRHGGHGTRILPDINQVDGHLRSRGVKWTEALQAAGLQPHRPKAHAALTPLEATRRYADENGYAPRGLAQLRKWGAAAGEAVKEHRAPEMRDALAQVNAEREAAGQPPLEPTPRGFTFAHIVRRENASAPKRSRGRSKAELIGGMARAMHYLQPGENLGIRELKRIARDHAGQDIPSSSTISAQAKKRGETFVQWRDEAAALFRRQEAAGGPAS